MANSYGWPPPWPSRASPTSCYWTSRPTTWTWTAWSGWSGRCSPPWALAAWCLFLTTESCWTGSPRICSTLRAGTGSCTPDPTPTSCVGRPCKPRRWRSSAGTRSVTTADGRHGVSYRRHCPTGTGHHASSCLRARRRWQRPSDGAAPARARRGGKWAGSPRTHTPHRCLRFATCASTLGPEQPGGLPTPPPPRAPQGGTPRPPTALALRTRRAQEAAPRWRSRWRALPPCA
mmetsp:Transcript_27489/g.88762  ORF Transcript_27489/g.88762 Transcript_27489/m.88762 type:complete len:232 (+) Transcript_27489:893-1588(+)